MEQLKQKILQEGRALHNSVLKVDSFLNHQIDPELMMAMGAEFARRFAGQKVTKILTIESSGIAVALATALHLHVPVVFARKKKSVLMNEETYVAKVFSFTKQEASEITVLKRFLPPGEHILIIDDFLASGEAAYGLASLVRQAGSQVTGIGIAIEKAFQPGAEKLRQAGYHVESLARVASLTEDKIEFVE